MARSREVPGGGRHGARPRPFRRLAVELWRLLDRDRPRLGAAMAATALAAVLGLVAPVATKIAIDGVLLGRTELAPRADGSTPKASASRLYALAVVAFAAAATATAAGLWGRWQCVRAAKRLQVRVRRRAFRHAMTLPLLAAQRIGSGAAPGLLREDTGNVGDLVFHLLEQPWRAAIQAAGGLAVLAWADARLLAIASAALPAAYFAEWLGGRTLRDSCLAAAAQRRAVDVGLVETFGGLRVVHAFRGQRRELARHARACHRLARLELLGWSRSRAVEAGWGLLLPGASAALLAYGGVRVLDGRITPGDLTMFLTCLGLMSGTIGTLVEGLTLLREDLASFERVLDLLDQPAADSPRPPAVRVRKASVTGRVTFEGVGFTYPGSALAAVVDVDLEVNPGEVVALVGRSGAGKSTLCSLAARLFDPTAGVVRLDGDDLREVELGSYRRLLGVVDQDVFLFDGTIGENIAYANPRAGRAAIERAVRAANASSFIAELPLGLETRLGERGQRLSGGQRQRLAIARAILADPRIVVLDEATSHLDSQTERLVRKALARLLRGRTALIVAHRLETVLGADRVVVMDSGRVVEAGTPAELWQPGGRLRDLANLQRIRTPGGPGRRPAPG